ncbi:hypothetical protein [Actinoplanes flavus]|uniref:Uncharacterized protein n=1 Tax=Actinoplanes flavus TaxID=2820290 RepID=A0ABS3UZE9_9ACTN|nr:hypothetical protein [Actinoplanes flavus]MBO3743916.1 hypothetical protein [Actinoplanes flavus]
MSAGASHALPLAAYIGSAEEQATLSRAEGILLQRCMHGLGFTGWRPTETQPATQWTTGLRIGIVDAELAGKYGYHPPGERTERVARATASPRQRAEIAALTGQKTAEAATTEPLIGRTIPDGGCEGEAERVLGAGMPAYDNELYGRLGVEADKATQRDDRVVGGLRAWSDCMKRAGHLYRNPWEAAAQTWAVVPTATEKALATADVACKTETGLPGIWFAVLGGYEQRLIDRNRAGLEATRAAVEARLRNAGAVLASKG